MFSVNPPEKLYVYYPCAPYRPQAFARVVRALGASLRPFRDREIWPLQGGSVALVLKYACQVGDVDQGIRMLVPDYAGWHFSTPYGVVRKVLAEAWLGKTRLSFCLWQL